MALYPIIQFAFGSGPYLLPSGTLGVFPITIAPGETLTLDMRQLVGDPEHLPQDQSIRCWISPKQGGMSVSESATSRWHLSALQRDIVQVVDGLTVAASETGISIPVTPGTYWLNVLNLVNQKNSFSVEIVNGG